jgi:hypothetical protein
VLYQCLTGRRPFEREGDVQTQVAQLEEPPPRVSAIRSDVSREIDGVVARAMAKTPAERYATCRELVADARAKLAPPSRSPRSRRALLIAAAVAALALATAGVGAWIASGGHSAAKASFDSIQEELLVAHIPSKIASTCAPAAAHPPQVFLRAVSCEQGGEQRGVTYLRAHNGKALKAHFEDLLAERGIHKLPTQSFCRNARPSARPWAPQGPDGEGHSESKAGRAEGRVVCFDRGPNSWIMWTDTPTKILAQAWRPKADYPALYAWWKDNAGPQKNLREMHMEPVKPGQPDAITDELLLAHIPKPIRKHCNATQPDDEAFLRAVECRQKSGGETFNVRYEYAHDSTDLKNLIASEAAGHDVNFDTSTTCLAALKKLGSAADTWTRIGPIGHVEGHNAKDAEGRVLCYADQEGDVTVEWTDRPTLIFGKVAGPSRFSAELYRWWSQKAGPGTEEMEGGGMHTGS